MDEGNNYCTISGAFKDLQGDVYVGGYRDGKKVLAIEDGAFEGCTGITSIHLLDGILTIGDNAFDGCDNLGYLDDGLAHLYAGEDLTGVIRQLFINLDAMGYWSCTVGGQYNEITAQALRAIKGLRRPLLELRDVSIRNDEGAMAIDGVNFYIRGGEILGVAGIAGCGQKELCEAIAGLRPIEKGQMIHEGDNIVGLSPKEILKKGISMSFIPEDRLGMGLAPSLSITDNMILKNYADTKGIFVDRHAGRASAEQVIRELEVVTPSTETPVRRLSGGNVQKVWNNTKGYLRKSYQRTSAE